MTNVIQTSDGKSLALLDGVTNRTYSVGLLGTLEEVYDSTIAQNFYQMNENFASVKSPDLNIFVNYDNNNANGSSPSVTPLVGQLWFDTSVDKLKIYSIEEKWETVGKEFNEGDFVPVTDNTVDIGSEDLYWHFLYGVHLNTNTNRFFGQIGVSDPDGIPSLKITGDSVLGNSISSGVIRSNVGSKVQLGDFNTPIKTVYAKELLLGTYTVMGLTTSISEPNHILPSSNSSTNVSFGTKNFSFNHVVVDKIRTDVLDSRDDTLSIEANTIIPSADVNLGDYNAAWSSLYVKDIFPEEVREKNTGSFTVDSDVAVGIYEKISQNITDGGSVLPNDTVSVLSTNGEVSRVEYRNLVPLGFMTMWSGSILPAGWVLCDGKIYVNGEETTNSNAEGAIITPDMRNMFCVALPEGGTVGRKGNVEFNVSAIESSTKTSSLGGSHTHVIGDTVLDLDQIPRHNHTYYTYDSGDSKSDSGPQLASSTINDDVTFSSVGNSEGHDHSIPSEGSIHDHDAVIPKHTHTINPSEGKSYKLAYIMRVA